MSGPFAITAASNTIVLDNRRGQASFTVTNVSGRPLRGRARLVPQDAMAASWLSIIGDGERDFAIADTQQYVAQVAVPLGTPTGSYLFRLDMVGVENPDEDFTEGPTVTFKVQPSEPPPPPPKSKGYVVALVGSVVGGLAGGLALAGLGAILALVTTSSSDSLRMLGVVILAVIAFVPGYWIGSAVGCWLALLLRKQLGPVQTALVHWVVFPIWAVLVVLALSRLSDALGAFILVLVFLLVTIVPPLVARAAIVRLKTGGF